MMSNAKIVDVLMKFFPDEPCNYNGMDELADCKWCCDHCGHTTPAECWKHAIEERWYDKV